MFAFNSADDIRLALSLVIIGQQALLVLLLLFKGPQGVAQKFGALLLLGVVAYLALSNPALSEVMLGMRPLLIAFAIAVPYLLWEFCIALFEMRAVSARIRLAIYIVPAATWLSILAGGGVVAQVSDWMATINRVISLLIVAHAVTSVFAGLRDDLLEPRRRYRRLFVLFVAVQVGAVIIVELLVGAGDVSAWLELVNVVMIGVLTLGLGLPLLSVSQQFFWEHEPESRVAEAEVARASLSPAERVLKDALDEALSSGFYRTPGLGIREFAAHLNVAEHHLRKLVNQQLGFRNFSAFLNEYRVKDATEMLSDSDRVRIPILTIAMDLGYGSIGPFNRAFKQATGLTPSEFRRNRLGDSSVDSE